MSNFSKPFAYVCCIKYIVSYTMKIDKKGFTVLIVEDSLLIVKRLWLLLSDIKGVGRIAHAKDANEALLLTSELNPNVIILDIKIPGRNGVEILQDLRKKSSAKMIMLTNYSDRYYKELCMKLGAEYFLDKSSEFDKINQIVSSIKVA